MARPREFDEDVILRQALFLFWKNGYDATSLSDIEHATGVARMSLYNVFGNKEAIFLLALERYIKATKHLYERHLRSDCGIAGIEALLEAYMKPDKLSEAGTWGCLMLGSINASGGVSPKARDVIESFRRFAIDEIENALHQAARRGEIDVSFASADMADLILTTMWGAKAVIRHTGTTKASSPAARMLSHILRDFACRAAGEYSAPNQDKSDRLSEMKR
jgi:AcrR family transcriptional regulator